MLSIVIFAFGIMYTPGPVNLLSLNNGLQKNLKAQWPFSIGVGIALYFWFTIIGYAGTSIINESMLPYIGLLGCGFILYLAYKVLSAQVDVNDTNKKDKSVTFKDGFLIQLLNPKCFMVVLPVATVQFPANGIDGPQITLWAMLLGLMGFGAPMVYALAGLFLGKRIVSPGYFKIFNVIMGLMLIFVALDLAYEQVYLQWF